MYSCGFVLWSLFFKIAPFNGLIDGRMVRHLKKGRRLPMTIAIEGNGGDNLLPPPLEQLITELWAHEPAARPSAPEAFTTARDSVLPVLMQRNGVLL